MRFIVGYVFASMVQNVHFNMYKISIFLRLGLILIFAQAILLTCQYFITLTDGFIRTKIVSQKADEVSTS